MAHSTKSNNKINAFENKYDFRSAVSFGIFVLLFALSGPLPLHKQPY